MHMYASTKHNMVDAKHNKTDGSKPLVTWKFQGIYQNTKNNILWNGMNSLS